MTNATVLSRVYDILRAHNATTIFGNPGSNELPFIADLPEGFRYIQCLHEGIAVSIAEGFSQSTGYPAVVNLHSNSGSGNGMGMLTNAHYSHTPLVVIAGQQVRDQVGIEMMLTNVDASTLTKPLTKWSYEPLAAQDVPRAVSQAVLEAIAAPQGPTYLSIPWDDWAKTAHPDDVLLTTRTLRNPGHLGDELTKDLAARMDGWKTPILILGPDVDAARAQDAAVALAERLGAEVWAAPSASRCPFPTNHPNFRGVLELSRKKVHDRLEGHDGVLIVGAPIFRYHGYEPSPYVPDGIDVVHLTVDPAEAARAPFSDSIVCALEPALSGLANAVQNRSVSVEPRTIPPPIHVDGQITGEEVLDIIAAKTPDTATYVNEVTSMSDAFMSRVPITRPDGYKLCASGGLGFGMAAAVGAALARPDDLVVAAIGDGSSNYAIQALYTAMTHKTRVIFVIFNNSKYGAVIHFAESMGSPDAPGLDIPGIDFMGLAKGYGVPATSVNNLQDFEEEYTKALDATGPILIEAKIAFT